MKISDYHFIKDTDSGYYPIASLELNRRVKNKESSILVVVGEAGLGKSYLGIQLARNIDRRFDIDQITFTYSEYVKQLESNKMGLPIVFDEPSYAMGKHEWYKQINLALSKTIESQRFLVRPLIIPIINLNLLNKTLRDYLIQFQFHVTKRGKATVYRIRASQYTTKIYRYRICLVDYPILDGDKCVIDTCLDCKQLGTCQLLRAKYERKKSSIQRQRYLQDEERARTFEVKELTINQLCNLAKPFESKYLEDNNVNARLLQVIFREELGINVSTNKSYILKETIEYRIEKKSV